jgi:hypothetical protein
MSELDAGYYWVRPSAEDECEPAAWNSEIWIFLGSEIEEDGDAPAPFEIGPRIAAPANPVRF